ncbi:hypothetical protein QBC42DRAFT_326554 [Cladorrhinum samala]|uniref:CFEM domain-containing protein n=1 Tax=Cladorrhinum samala TaxID=585594 RepID=A0AAV9HSB4_9PEZI|nr:hypothetical protein QBC42DRAFT_326554 [Cladorrhinum samala]
MTSVKRTLAIIGLCFLSLIHLTLARTHEAASQSGLISVQDAIAALPECAIPCLRAAMATSSCDADDFDCLCRDTKYYRDSSHCVHRECTVRQALTAKNLTYEMCGHPAKGDGALVPTFFAFFALAVLAVALRLIARAVTKAYFWWDDAANFCAAACCAAYTGLNVDLISIGLGEQVWFVQFGNITRILQGFYANMLLYTLTRFFVRCSMILFYMRIFPANEGTTDGLGRMVVASLVFNFIYNAAFFFAVMFQCRPIPYYWYEWEGAQPDAAVPMEGHCGNGSTLMWVAATTGIAFDLWLTILPFPQLLSLNLYWKRKLLATVMFMVGIVVIIISAIRLKTINRYTRTANFTKETAPLCLWSGIELDLGVVCPCLPSFRLLFKKMFPTAMASGDGSSHRYRLDPISAAGPNDVVDDEETGPGRGEGPGTRLSRPTEEREVYDGGSFDSAARLVPDAQDAPVPPPGDEESQISRNDWRKR